MTKKTEQYYQSHSKLDLIGESGQRKLSHTKVLVIGAGGLGCPCLLMLATSGIGTIGVADFDRVSVSNLHRQTLYNFSDIDEPKSKIAARRLVEHNPYVSVIQHHVLVDEGNVLDLLSQYDLVVDGTDNFAVRYLVNDACVYLNKPLVYGAIYQTEGHVTIFNYKGSATLRCLFAEPDAETYVPSCADVGAYNVVTQVIGVMMANEVIKIVTGNAAVLADKLMTYDALSSETKAIKYRAKPESREKSAARFKEKAVALDIAVDDFLKLDKATYQLIDVREEWEREEFNIGGLHVPLAEISGFDDSALSKSERLIFYCEQGMRSASAAQYFYKKGFVNAISLRGGMNAYKAFAE